MATDTARSRAARIRRFHATLLDSHADRLIDTAQLCGWSSATSQAARFNALMHSIKYDGGSIVDYGCGTGDLYAYMCACYGPINYTGLDCDASMLAIARRTHDAPFLQCALDEVSFAPTDYVVASGIFQFHDPAHPRYYADLAATLFDKARVAFGATFLSAMRDDGAKHVDELYFGPSELASLAASLSPRWAIDHSYHPGFGDAALVAFHSADTPQWTRPSIHHSHTVAVNSPDLLETQDG